MRGRDELRARRVERLAAEIRGGLDGIAEPCLVADVAVDEVDLWREAARRVGRERGWTIRTRHAGEGRVWMTRVHPRAEWTLPERVAMKRADRAAAARVADYIFGDRRDDL